MWGRRLRLVLTIVAPLLAPGPRIWGQAPAVAATIRVAVATRALARGAVLSPSDFELRDTTLRAASVEATPVGAGWVARRTIAAGEILRAPAVEPPIVVEANSPVQLEYADADVRVTVRAIATRSGALGERIAVRTAQGRRIDGRIVGPGHVRIE